MRCTSESSWGTNARIVGASMAREMLVQPGPKLLGLAVLCSSVGAWSSGDDTLLTGLVVSASAGAGVFIATRVAAHHFGTSSAASKAAIALSAAAGGAAGAALAIGNEAALAGVESAVAVAALALCAARVLANRRREEVPEWVNGAITLSSIAAGVVVWGAMGLTMPRELTATRFEDASNGFLMARQAGALVEALSVEISKEILGGCGPSVDRKALTFDARIESALKALLPYLAACALINGVVAPSLLPNGDGASQDMSFTDMLPSVLVTCLTNVLRNGLNSAATLHTWADGRRDGVPANPAEHVPASKTAAERAGAIADRWAIRSILMTARTATYVFMRMHGYSVEVSAVAAQAKYALFTQFREVLTDVMAGESWAPEVVARLRETDPPSRNDIDLEAIEAQFDPVQVELEYQRALENSNLSAPGRPPDLPSPTPSAPSSAPL